VALVDVVPTREAIAANPDCVCYRISVHSGPFPGIGFEGKGESILQWRLGFYREAYDLMIAATGRYGVAKQMGNQGDSPDQLFQFEAWQEAGRIEDVTRADSYANKWRR